MTEFRHDPNSLADRLDQLLPPGQPEQIGSDGDPLIETAALIASAPHPSLSPEAMARIQAQITRAQPTPQSPFNRLPSPLRLALVAVVSILLVAGAVFAAHELGITLVASTATPTASSTPTAPNSSTPSATESATSSPTMTVTTQPTVTSTLTPTHTTTPTAIETATPTPTPTLPPTDTSSSTGTATIQPGMVVVEGPVQAINGNIVVVYDIEIEVDPNDPALAIIQVGDQVRIEGTIGVSGTTIVVIAVNIVVVNVDVNVSPDGEVWRDTGDCSNPPPDWAPAHGWRARCEGAPHPGNSGGMGSSDDDDDERD